MTKPMFTCPDCSSWRRYAYRGLCGTCVRKRKAKGIDLPPLAKPVNQPCRVSGCPHQAKAQRLCSDHYNRMVRFGDPEVVGRKTQNREAAEAATEFWATAEAHAPGPCWEWRGLISENGYGIWNAGLGTSLATRSLWISYFGPIEPSSLCILHSCDNPPCVRPAHLRLGTKKDNTEDMLERHREYRAYGDDHWDLKLTDAQVGEIRRLSATGLNNRSIWRRFSWVDESHIGKIIRGQARAISANDRPVTTERAGDLLHTRGGP